MYISLEFRIQFRDCMNFPNYISFDVNWSFCDILIMSICTYKINIILIKYIDNVYIDNLYHVFCAIGSFHIRFLLLFQRILLQSMLFTNWISFLFKLFYLISRHKISIYDTWCPFGSLWRHLNFFPSRSLSDNLVILLNNCKLSVSIFILNLLLM